MQLETAFETVPDDEKLLYSIEHWDADDFESPDCRVTDSMVEAFVHPRTGTGARILESDDGEYSIQPSMGDFASGDCVVQTDDPTTLVSGGASVVMMELETLSEARAVAYVWLHGWVMRNSHIGDREGDVVDAEKADWAEPTN